MNERRQTHKKNKNSLFMIHDDNFWMAQRNCAVYLVAEDLETYIIQTLHEPKKQKTHISKTHISLCICNSDLPFNLLGFPHLQE